MIKGYIFDYGATLDTAGCHWGKMIWHAYERQQVPATWQQFREAYVYAERTLGRNLIIKPNFTFKKTLDIKIRLEMEYLATVRNGQSIWAATEEEFEQKHRAVVDDLYEKVTAITAHSREVLQQLNEKYPMVLVSNFYGNINEVLKEFGFDGLFADVIESAVVGVRKPNPEIFRLGVKALGLPAEEVVVVGDSFYKDIIPAKEAGCQTVWFTGEGWNDDKYDESIPDKIIRDISELLERGE